MNTIIYLVRHGEVYNPDGILYERLPGFRLSVEGRNQVHKLGKHLSGKSVDHIYASPLERAQETAKIIASYHDIRDIQPDERLIEVYAPALVGKPLMDLADTRWNFYTDELLRAGGESLEDIWARMDQFLREIVAKHRGQTIVAVSHGDPVVVTAIKYQGKPLHIEHMRGKNFIPTAQGFELIFTEYDTVEVSRLDF